MASWPPLFAAGSVPLAGCSADPTSPNTAELAGLVLPAPSDAQPRTQPKSHSRVLPVGASLRRLPPL